MCPPITWDPGKLQTLAQQILGGAWESTFLTISVDTDAANPRPLRIL